MLDKNDREEGGSDREKEAGGGRAKSEEYVKPRNTWEMKKWQSFEHFREKQNMFDL